MKITCITLRESCFIIFASSSPTLLPTLASPCPFPVFFCLCILPLSLFRPVTFFPTVEYHGPYPGVLRGSLRSPRLTTIMLISFSFTIPISHLHFPIPCWCSDVCSAFQAFPSHPPIASFFAPFFPIFHFTVRAFTIIILILFTRTLQGMVKPRSVTPLAAPTEIALSTTAPTRTHRRHPRPRALATPCHTFRTTTTATTRATTIRALSARSSAARTLS